jgi:hypothetical protein
MLHRGVRRSEAARLPAPRFEIFQVPCEHSKGAHDRNVGTMRGG